MKAFIFMLAIAFTSFSYANESDESAVRKLVDNETIVINFYTNKPIEFSSKTVDLSSLTCGLSLVYGNVCEAKFVASYQCEVGSASVAFLMDEGAVGNMMLYGQPKDCK